MICLAHGSRRPRGHARAADDPALWLHAPCRATSCTAAAKAILRKADRHGRVLRQIELCEALAAQVVATERVAGLQVSDTRA